MEATMVRRRLPVGAEALPEGGVHFRVWAPRRKAVAVLLEAEDGRRQTIEMKREQGGYYSVHAEGARASTLYSFRLDGGDHLYPDPASRFQPEGPHGRSCVIDPNSFGWTDDEWRGASHHLQVIYHMHL